jgi:hypothetical protein
VKEILGNSKEITTAHYAALARESNTTASALQAAASWDNKTKDAVEPTRKSLAAALAKRPWNADLRVLCWKAGESFVKVSNATDDIYGHLYAERKEQESARNEAGAFADQARHILATKNIGHGTDAYKAYSEGKLPPAHIHARAKRWAVKLFLAHLHHVLHEVRLGTPPPKPYILTQDNHTHYMRPPQWPME